MTEAKNLYQNRRSVYALGKNLPISEQEVIEIIDNAVKYSPSAFNSNTAHAVVLLGDNHQKLWDITYAELAKLLPTDEAKATTKGKIDNAVAAECVGNIKGEVIAALNGGHAQELPVLRLREMLTQINVQN